MNAAEIRRWLAERVAREAGCSPDQVRADQPFSYYGLESAASAAIAGEVADLVGREVEATALFRFPTIEDLAAFLTTPQATERQPGPGVRHQDGPGNRIGPGEPIAIVGIGARFPGADSPEAFWRSLTEGRDCISEQSGRWDTEADEPRQIRFGGFLDEIRGFDFDFFSLRKDEAIHMDPQQRLLLETSWEALEDAGRRPSQLRGSRTGVFVGISTAEYGWRQVHAASEGLHATAPTGNSLAVAANRISYFYDLRGPSVAVDTACSSSLVALHLAASSLRSGDCDQLLVCGVNLLIEPAVSTGLARAGMLAQDGRCRTFDAAASGYVRGEGCGAVVLAPLSVAVARGDRIYALLLGSAVNQDGRSNGLTAPNPAAQEAVLRAAHDNAGIAAHEVQYVECHGTGTLLGDPIEAGALGKVVGVGRPSPCLIGSVKTNIGHLESAAGIAGLIKTALALFHGEIPASLHFREPNPHIDFEELGLRVADASMPWPECDRRVAGLSSFGFGGANAHAVLAAAPQAAPGPSAGQPDVLLLPVSARSAPALSATASQWADFVESLDGDTLTDAVATAALRRDHHPVRAAVTGRSAAELARGLRAVGGATHRSPGRTMPGRVGFVFSGQGGQWPAMARRLLATSQIFASTIRACDEVTTREAGFAVSALLADDALGGSQDTAVAQPVLFAVQAGLTAIWRSYRVWPSAVIGHSVGEIAAAYAAGSLSLAEGAELACRRGSAMASTRGHGRMLVTDLDEGSASELLPGAGEITIAAVNSPRATVFAGQESDLARMHDDLIARSRFASWLPVPYAFHSAQMDEAADTLSRQLADLTTAAPAVPMYSTVTGKLRGEPFSASYWARNIRDTVRFADAMASMLSDGIDILLEIGPHPVLARSIGEVAAHLNLAVTQVGSLRREQDDQVALLTAAGELYRGGIDLDWRRIVPPGRLITAPTYPWQRTRCWLDRPSPVTPVPRGAHPMLGRRVDLAASADAHVFTAEIDLGRLPFLADHRVRGTAVLPATAYVELAVAAARAAGMTGPIEVAEFSFDSFLDLSQAPRLVQTTLRRKDTDTWLLTVHSRARDSGSTWDLHAHGELRACGDPGSADPAQIRERCVDHYGAERLYAALAELGLDYGPAFRAVVDVWTGRDEAIGDLRDGQPGYECDPAVLDGALHLVAAVGPPGPGLRVPVGIDLVRVAGRPVLATQARASTCAADRADVTLLADDGSVLVELSGVRFAAATAEPPAVQGGVWGYDILWRASDLVTLPGSADRRWLVLADDGPVGKTLADRIRKEGGNAELVERSGLDRLGQILESGVETVIDLRPLDAHQGQPPDSAMDHAVKAVELIRQLSLSGGARTPELWFVTRGAQPVGERACSDPVGAPIWGLSKVVPFENPALRCRMIDLDSVVADSAVALINSAVELIISEAQSPGRDTEIGFAAGRRFVRRLVPAASGRDDQAFAVRPEATYLVTGGFGALGRAVATWLAGQGATRLALLGRHHPGLRAVRMIDALRERGIQVDILLADVASRPELEPALAALRDSGARLGGAVHAAGVLDDGAMLSMDAASIRRVMAAKVTGAWLLDEMTRDDRLDWFAFFSSAASILGSPGQANYCAANAFLDAFAHYLRARGRQALSINWGPWGEVGMAAETRDGSQYRRAYADLEPAIALRTMGGLLAANASQSLVLPFDLRNLLQYYPVGLGLAFFDEVNTADVASLRSSGSAASPASRPEFDRDYVAPRSTIERRIAAIWQASLGVDRVGVFDRFFEYGGDSVFGNQLLLEIDRSLGVTIDTGRAFKDFTVAALAELAEECMAERLAQMDDSEIERLLSDGDSGQADDRDASDQVPEP